MTDTQNNVTLVTRFLDEVVNAGKVEVVDEIMAPAYVMRGGSLGTYDDRDGYKTFLQANAGGAFTDMKLDIRSIVADRDQVFVLFTNSGHNSGSFMGMAATGKTAKWNGSALFRIAEGRIVESDYVEDLVAMFGQLGVEHLPKS